MEEGLVPAGLLCHQVRHIQMLNADTQFLEKLLKVNWHKASIMRVYGQVFKQKKTTNKNNKKQQQQPRNRSMINFRKQHIGKIPK